MTIIAFRAMPFFVRSFGVSVGRSFVPTKMDIERFQCDSRFSFYIDFWSWCAHFSVLHIKCVRNEKKKKTI